MKISHFNKQNLNSFREAFKAKMDELEQETGVRVHLGNASYNDLTFNGKVKATIIGDNPKEALQKAAKQEWDRVCRKFDLKPTMFGQNIQLPDGQFKVVGIKSRSYKRPVIIENLAGKRYVTSPSTLLRQLNA